MIFYIEAKQKNLSTKKSEHTKNLGKKNSKKLQTNVLSLESLKSRRTYNFAESNRSSTFQNTSTSRRQNFDCLILKEINLLQSIGTIGVTDGVNNFLKLRVSSGTR